MEIENKWEEIAAPCWAVNPRDHRRESHRSAEAPPGPRWTFHLIKIDSPQTARAPRCCGRCWQHAGPHLSARLNLVGSGMSKKKPTTAVAFSCLIYSWLNSSLAGLIPRKKLPVQQHGGLQEEQWAGMCAWPMCLVGLPWVCLCPWAAAGWGFQCPVGKWGAGALGFSTDASLQSIRKR